MKDKKNLLKKIFSDIFEADNFDEKVIHKYFHLEYKQHVDGKILNFDQFVDHMKAIKDTLDSVKIYFEHLIEENDSVCSVHYAEGKKKDGNIVKAKVIAFFKFEQDKLILCDEMTHLVEGNTEDEDMGSRH